MQLHVLVFTVALAMLAGCTSDPSDDDVADDDVTDDDVADDDVADDDVADDDTSPLDADGDGHDESVDCDDADPSAYPGAEELCDGIDNDCDSVVPVDENDFDGDGQRGCEGDCNDDEALVGSGFDELCDGVDNDCDGAVPDDEADADGDGQRGCDGDCDDGDAITGLGFVEACDGIDNDCDGAVPADEDDGDADGQRICEGDCDDEDDTVYDLAMELCDGLDNDCDGVVPADEADGDGDGQMVCDGDCDDSDPAIATGLPEACDGQDTDCDGVIPADEDDTDGDGFLICDGDCDDTDVAAYPGAPQVCDGVLDNDCDGITDPDEQDDDGDLSTVCGGDCDDTDPDVHGLDLDGDGWSICDGDCDDTDAGFYPGVAGTPVADPQTTLVDVAFNLDFSTATFTQPQAVGPLFGGYLDEWGMHVQISGLDESLCDLDASMAFAVNGVQDLCETTADITAGATGVWNNPQVLTGPVDVVFYADGSEGTLFDTEYGWTFDASGTSLFDGTLEATLDTRVMDQWIDPSGPEGTACDLLASLGVSCDPCPDGSGSYCLPLAAEDITGSAATVVGWDPETGQMYTGLTEVTQVQVDDWINYGYCP